LNFLNIPRGAARYRRLYERVRQQEAQTA